MGLLRIPPRPSQAGWLVDREAVEAALLELRVRLPVRIVLTTGWRKAGSCGVDWDAFRIRLSGRHPLERASRILWHELAHAAQRERDARQGGGSYEPEALLLIAKLRGRAVMGFEDDGAAAAYKRGGDAHHEHPLEVAARAVAAAHEGELLLRPAKGR